MKSWLKHLWREWLAPLSFGLLFTQFGAAAVRVDGASMLPTLRHNEWLAIPKLEGWAHQLGLGSYQRGDIVVFKPPGSATYEWTHEYRGISLPWAYRPYLVKRIVGLPGDRVQMKQGRLYLNGQLMPESRVLNYWHTFCHDIQSELANSVAASPSQPNQPEVIPDCSDSICSGNSTLHRFHRRNPVFSSTPSGRVESVYITDSTEVGMTVPAGHYFVMGDNRSPGGSLDSRMFGPVARHDIAGRAVASLFPLFARAQAIPPCDGQSQPEQRVQYSGEAVFSPRWLVGQEP